MLFSISCCTYIQTLLCVSSLILSCWDKTMSKISFDALGIQTTWWRHQMEIFSALLAICAWNHRSPVNYPHKGQRRGALMFSLICAWINGWVNNREAGDLRHYIAHYDVTVMANTQNSSFLSKTIHTYQKGRPSLHLTTSTSEYIIINFHHFKNSISYNHCIVGYVSEWSGPVCKRVCCSKFPFGYFKIVVGLKWFTC